MVAYAVMVWYVIPMNVQGTLPQLRIHLSSWRWTVVFETCKRHQN